MSTKATLAYDDSYHLYHEVFDGGIYLDITDPETASIERENGHTYVTVRLPESLIKRLKLGDQQLEELDDISTVDTSEALKIFEEAKNAKK